MAWDYGAITAALDRMMGTPGPFGGRHCDHVDGVLVMSDSLASILREIVDWLADEVPEVLE